MIKSTAAGQQPRQHPHQHPGSETAQAQPASRAVQPLRVLVTGATKGIGRATALRLARNGHVVVAMGRDVAELKSLAQQTGCSTVQVDVADTESLRRAASEAGRVDGLVNCAGIVRLARFVDACVEDLDETMAVNLRAPMVLSQCVARDWMARDVAGSIVNVSSIAARVGTPDHAAYCASKGALDAMTRVMAVELGGHHIRVNAVNPAITLTPMAAQAWSDPARSGRMLARIPMRRFIEPDEVASVIEFLLGPDAAMVHGVCLEVDGGFRAG